MAAPVWVLSVDLQTKTATFQTGLADAARSARGAFSDIKSGAGEMGGSVSYSTMEARHSVMMLGEEFGVHLPRSLTTFISSLGPLGPALEMAFPFLAIILGATLLLEHLSKLREAGHKLTEDQEQFQISAQKAFNSLGDKVLEAQKRVEELRGNHLAALKDELELIDHQSLEELSAQFDALAKGADKAFAEIKSHWYTFGAGSDGAKRSLEDFQRQYETLLVKRDETGAHALLGAKIEREKGILEAQKLADANKGSTNLPGFESGDHAKFMQGYNVLKQIGVGYTKNEIAAQETLVNALQDTLTVERAIADEKKAKDTGAHLAAGKASGKDAAAAARALAEAQQKGVDEEGRIIREANRAAEESTAEGWREQIEDTKQGSAERLAAINAAIADELSRGMEGTAAYRSMLTVRVALLRKMTEDSDALSRSATQVQNNNDERMSELSLARLRQQMALADSEHRRTAQQQIADASDLANREYQIKHDALENEIANLDQSGNDYLNKLKGLQDKEKQLYQQHENELSAIREKAEIETNNKLSASYQHFTSAISGELTKSIMGHQTWAKMVQSLGDQAVSSMMENAIKSAMTMDFGKEKDAAKAARKAFNYGMEYGGPAAPVLAPILAAGAFTAVMAFAGGTDRVPGVGRGDSVPSMLTPGEGIVPGGVMDGLRNVARNGGFAGGGSHFHLHGVNFAPTVHALDSSGVDKVLDKHADKFQAHFENVLRKMNR